MGKKGDKLTSASNEAADFLVDKLAKIGGVTAKKMFGGNGIFHDGKMFGLINPKGEIYLKADDSNIADFEKFDANKHSRMPYYSIPETILSDDKKLVAWAKKSIKISKG